MSAYYLPIEEQYCALEDNRYRLIMWPLIKFLKEEKKVNFNQTAYDLLEQNLTKNPVYINHKQTYCYILYKIFSYTKSENKGEKTQISIPIGSLQHHISYLNDIYEAYNLLLKELKKHKKILNSTIMKELEHVIEFKGYYYVNDITYERWYREYQNRDKTNFTEDYTNPFKPIINQWKKIVDENFLPIKIEYVLNDIKQEVFNYAVYCEVEEENQGKKCGFLGQGFKNVRHYSLFTLAEAKLFQTQKQAQDFIQKQSVLNHCAMAIVQTKPQIHQIVQVFGEPIHIEREVLSNSLFDEKEGLDLAQELLNKTQNKALLKALKTFIDSEKIENNKTKTKVKI